MANTACIQD